MTIVKYTFRCMRNCCHLPCRVSVVESEGYLSSHKKDIEERLNKMCVLSNKANIVDWKFERKDNNSKFVKCV